MDDIVRLALDAKLDKRDFDGFKTDTNRALDKKANSDDVGILAAKVSGDQADHAERNRTIQARLSDVDRALKALAVAVQEDSGGPVPRRSFIYRVPAPVLVAGSLLAGAAAMKSPEMLHAIMKLAGQ